jgi:hypothetical protein
MMKLLRITCSLLVLLLSLVAFAFIAVHPAAAQTLNPPPPPEYSCRAGANVTICQADVTFSYGPVDIGIVCGSGKSAFDIFDSATLEQHKIRYYDQNGNLTRRVIHENYTFGQWSNPQTGKVVPYTQHDTITDVLAVPGDLTTSTETLTGENIYRAGSGAPVLFNTGRQVFNSDESVLISSAGRSFRAASIEGDTTVFNDVCAALA